MKFEDRLNERIGRDPGFRVPDGFFEEQFARISASLPEREAPKPVKLSMWARVKPYIYMAAMFAGIWCTMKMFTLMQATPDVSLDNPPAAVASVMQDPHTDLFIPDVYDEPDFESDYELESSLKGEYEDFDDFAREFEESSTANPKQKVTKPNRI